MFRGFMALVTVPTLCLILLVCPVTMATLFAFGSSSRDSSLDVRDQYTDSINLRNPFTFAGASYTDLYVSDNGAVAFLANAGSNFLNAATFATRDQWIAPLGCDVINGNKIWYQAYHGMSSKTELDQATLLVNTLTGSVAFEADYLMVVTWDQVVTTGAEPPSTFQLVLTKSSSESYAIFLYDSLNVQTSDITVGVSLGGGAFSQAWTPSGTDGSCAPGSTGTVQDLVTDAQTSCGTDPGVLLFAVHDASALVQAPICTFVPQSGCASEENTNKLSRCQARRKRRAVNDL